jgi:hypothetical protein
MASHRIRCGLRGVTALVAPEPLGFGQVEESFHHLTFQRRRRLHGHRKGGHA